LHWADNSESLKVATWVATMELKTAALRVEKTERNSVERSVTMTAAKTAVE
jgi:hypothetical protein